MLAFMTGKDFLRMLPRFGKLFYAECRNPIPEIAMGTKSSTNDLSSCQDSELLTGNQQRYLASEMLTREQLAHKYGVSIATIDRRRKAGQIPYFQPGGKRTRVTFPPNAYEQVPLDQRVASAVTQNQPQQSLLSGPQPRWKKGS